jgi:ribonuclease HII
VAARRSGVRPDLRTEKRLLREGAGAVACVDECGRGALAGPASVGIVVVDTGTRRLPSGLRDSKLLSPSARVGLVPRIAAWATSSAVGHASAAEVDEVGILGALRLAARRALDAIDVDVDVVLLDGSHDWFSAPAQPGLFESNATPGAEPPVVTEVKADLRCAGVAAASVLAKVERDALMERLAAVHPGYGFERNKGYASAEHVEALGRLGACDEHRRSWQLPGLSSSACRP